MLTSLAQAPIGVPLTITRITDSNMAVRIASLGLYEGSGVTRLNENVAISSAKVKGIKGEAVLSGWLAGLVVMHLDDGRRLPLLECPPRSSGHVEGLTGHDMLEKVLKELGIVQNDHITFLRRIPPMMYKAQVDGKYNAQMNEGLAAKLLGDTPDGAAQFCSTGVGEAFIVRRILAGANATKTLQSMHITVGSTLVLQSVSASQIVNLSDQNPIVCMTKAGLRLYFKERDAATLLVTD